MYFRPLLLSIAAAFTVVISAPVSAACPPGAKPPCVNFDSLPQISQDIVAREQPALGAKKAAAAPSFPYLEKAPYTGPTVGFTKTVKPAPTVGYKWSID
jgi:hypothetical protein